MSVSVFERLPQAFSTSATALGKRFSSMSHNIETLTLGSLEKPSERAAPRERIPMIAMLTVLFGLCRAKPVLISGPAPSNPVRPVAPAPTCLTKLRRLMDVMSLPPFTFHFPPEGGTTNSELHQLRDFDRLAAPFDAPVSCDADQARHRPGAHVRAQV